MYKGTGAFTGKFEKKHEWCEFDPMAARKIAKSNLIRITINIFVILFIILYFLVIQVIMNLIPIIIISIIISLIISLVIGNLYWTRKFKWIAQYIDSYSINLTIDRKTIEENVELIGQALLKMDILYGYNQTVKNDKAFHSKFTRNDNSALLIRCNGILNEDIKYCIFTKEFGNKKDVKILRDIIWDGEKNSLK